MNGEVGVIYLVHFDEPLGDPDRPRMSARHYLGWASQDCLQKRLEEHRKGTGARILAAASARGIGWTVVRLEDGTRDRERRLKKNGHHERRCSICTGKKGNVWLNA